MIKRLIDIGLSGFGLIVSAPLWLVIPAAIKFEDGGPTFFRLERVGRDGRVFHALKFRSMIPHAEALSGPVQATENDPRITRIGRLLRATAMDELPQLVNILVGDMSFVGPRPLRPGEIDVADDGVLIKQEDIPGYQVRHRVRPGLTGLWQVSGRSTLSYDERVSLDMYYIRNHSIWLDLQILFVQTLPAVVFGRGAY